MKYLVRIAPVSCLLMVMLILGPALARAEYPLEFFVEALNSKLEKRYVGRETAEYVSIYDNVLRKTIWENEKGGSTRGHRVFLKIGPKGHYGIVSHEFGICGQELSWVDLTQELGKNRYEVDAPAMDIWIQEKVRKAEIRYLYFHPQKWLSESSCALIWDGTSYDQTYGDSLYDAGVVTLTLDLQASPTPMATLGKHKFGMSGRESLRLERNDYVKLLPKKR